MGRFCALRRTNRGIEETIPVRMVRARLSFWPVRSSSGHMRFKRQVAAAVVRALN